MTAGWRDFEDLDEEGRPFDVHEAGPRPWNAQEWVLGALVLAMVVVCLALAAGWTT